MRRRNSSLLIAAALLLASATLAFAERADRDKPINVEADRLNVDDTKKTAVFEGHVVLTQGTLVLRAERLTIRQDSEGFQFAEASGNPASFRQKREGADEYINAEAQRIEYDGRAERVQFFEQAHLYREGGDDVRGNYISYDSRNEYFTVQSAKNARAEATDSRVRAVIMPRKTDSAAQKAAPPQRKIVPTTASPRQE
jgi:lipopolysaccharide export system protein LptA